MWSKEARNLTFRAAVEAGFSKRYFKGFRAAYLITEPEAAALYTIKTMQADDPDEDIIMVCPNKTEDCNVANKYQQGDCFVQADMGGGTVVSIRVKSLKHHLNCRVRIASRIEYCGHLRHSAWSRLVSEHVSNIQIRPKTQTNPLSQRSNVVLHL